MKNRRKSAGVPSGVYKPHKNTLSIADKKKVSQKIMTYTYIPEPKIKKLKNIQISMIPDRIGPPVIRKNTKKNIKEEKIKLPVNILLPPDKKKGLFLSSDTFITKWEVLGAFPINKENISPQTIHKVFLPDEPNICKRPVKKGIPHYTVEADNNTNFPGQINPAKFIGSIHYGVIYARTKVSAPSDMNNITMCTGNDDYIKIWINGKLVHTYNREPRAAEWDQDVINNIKLNKGENFIVVKLVFFSSKPRFYFRFMTSQGVPICIKK